MNLRSRWSVKPKPTVGPTQQQVYDCITKEPRGAGQPWPVKTVELKNSTVWEGVALPEERSKSQEEFVKIYKTKGWGGDQSNPLDASGKSVNQTSNLSLIIVILFHSNIVFVNIKQWLLFK